MRQSRLLAAMLAILLLASCAAQPAPGSAGPYPPVPALIPEDIPRPPVAAEALLWQPGHWDWTGSGYVWSKGQYVPAQGHGSLWMFGWWSQTPQGWTWQPPHWTS